MKEAINLIENLQKQLQMRIADNNLNARELERRAGLKMSAVRNILSGSSKNPGIEVIVAIARILNCSTDELLGFNQEKSKSEETKQKKIKLWDYALYKSCLKEVQNYLSFKNIEPSWMS